MLVSVVVNCLYATSEVALAWALCWICSLSDTVLFIYIQTRAVKTELEDSHDVFTLLPKTPRAL